MPYPLPLTRTEAYLAYKAGVIQQSDLKPSLAVSRNGIDAWLAYWTGLTKKFPIKGITKNLWEWNKYDEYSVTNRTTYEIDGDNNLVVSTTSGSYQNVTFLVELEDGEYTFSLGSVTNTNPSMTVKRMTLATRNSDGSGRTVVQQVSAGTPRTVTITNEPNKIYTLEFWGTDGTSLNNTATYSQVQIEKGDEATSYEPYTGEPEMLTEEEAFIAYLSGVINEYPEKCLRRVGAYLRYLISARWGRPDHPLNREELYLSLIKTQFIPSGDPSSDIVIDGTTKAPFQDVKMYGDTFQQTYTGKNLFNKDSANVLVAYIDAVVSVITANSQNRLIWVPCEPNTTYTVSRQRTSGGQKQLAYTTQEPAVGVQVYGKVNWAADSTECSITTGEDARYIVVRIWQEVQESDISLDNLLKLVQIEKSSSATSYEPFVGGVPSPSPDYPQPIQTVTGLQTVEVQGKNIINATILQDAWSNNDGVSIVHSSQYVRTVEYTPVDASTTYTLSYLVRGSVVMRGNILQYDSNKSFISSVSIAFNTTFTTISNAAFVRFNLYHPDSLVPNDITNLQLELGSNATAYIPYTSTDYPIDLGTIELCKLGTYQDYIYKDGEDWKVHKATKSITASSNDFSSTSSSGGFRRATIALAGMANSGSASRRVGSAITNLFHSSTTDGASAQFQTLANMVIYASSATQTYQELMDSIDESGMIVTYALATPTDTTITDQTLIAQLDSLVNGGAEDGTTYIKINATDPNLPGLLYVEAPKYE